MSNLVFKNVTAILPDRLLEQATITCQRGQVVDVADKSTQIPLDSTVIDGDGCFLAPGYIDLHVHGGQGADFMDGDVAAVRVARDAHLRHGTTTIFPTTTTGSPDQIKAMLDACATAAKDTLSASIPGIHLYGPYFAADKVGCHALEGRREPLLSEYHQYFATGLVRIATCAAELKGSERFYQTAQQHDCLITCGHSNASWPEMQTAFDFGVRHVDHFWCAMSSVPSLRQRFGVPMQASMAEFVLMNQEMSTEVIADGHHLSAELLEFAYQMLGPHRLCLVTDCNRALDMPAGKYRFGNFEDGNWFKSDGRVGWAPDGHSLASSVVGMDHMVRHFHACTSASLPEVVRMASLTPAERVGIADQVGSIQNGKRADLLLLDDRLHVRQVYLAGQLAPVKE